MYKISVPIMLSTLKRSGGHEMVLGDLKKLGAERVFLALGQTVRTQIPIFTVKIDSNGLIRPQSYLVYVVQIDMI